MNLETCDVSELESLLQNGPDIGDMHQERFCTLVRPPACSSLWLMEEWPTTQDQLGMYGPPPCRKRKVNDKIDLRKCIRPVLERDAPGQDGMRCAAIPFN